MRRMMSSSPSLGQRFLSAAKSSAIVCAFSPDKIISCMISLADKSRTISWRRIIIFFATASGIGPVRGSMCVPAGTSGWLCIAGIIAGPPTTSMPCSLIAFLLLLAADAFQSRRQASGHIGQGCAGLVLGKAGMAHELLQRHQFVPRLDTYALHFACVIAFAFRVSFHHHLADRRRRRCVQLGEVEDQIAGEASLAVFCRRRVVVDIGVGDASDLVAHALERDLVALAQLGIAALDFLGNRGMVEQARVFMRAGIA